MAAQQGEAPGGPGSLTRLPANVSHVPELLQYLLQAAPRSGDPLLTPSCAVKLPARNCAPSVSLSVRPVQLPLRYSAPAVHSSPWPTAGSADGAQGQHGSPPHNGPAGAGAAAGLLTYQQQEQPPVAMLTLQQRQQSSSECSTQQQPAQEHAQAGGPGKAAQCSMTSLSCALQTPTCCLNSVSLPLAPAEPAGLASNLAELEAGDATLATQDAFACINAMFGSNFDTVPTGCHRDAGSPGITSPASQPVPLSAMGTGLSAALSPDQDHSRPEAGASAALVPAEECRRPEEGAAAAQQAKRQREQPADLTLSTQAAYEALNSMFQSDLPHEAGRRQQRAAAKKLAMQQAVAGAQRQRSRFGLGSRAAPRQAARSSFAQDLSQQLAAKAPPKALQALVSAERQAAQVEVHEDTDLLMQGQQPCPPAAPAASQAEDALGMYEDTQFLPEPCKDAEPAAEDAGDLGIYEDTQFMPRPQYEQSVPQAAGLARGLGGHRLAHAALPAAGPSCRGAPPAGAAGGLDLYEDTRFLEQPQAAPAAARPASPAADGFGIYEDTQFLAQLTSRQQQPLAGCRSDGCPDAAGCRSDTCAAEHQPGQAGAAGDAQPEADEDLYQRDSENVDPSSGLVCR